MKYIRKSSWEEYVKWYLHREQWKKAARESVDLEVPETPAEQKDKVKQLEKFHDWFDDGRAVWAIVELSQDEFERLIPAYQCFSHRRLAKRWLKRKNTGLLKEMAELARRKNYIYWPNSEVQQHKDYYEQFKLGRMHLTGEHRIVICTADRASGKEADPAINPDSFYHLEDGWGRSLPYQILLLEGKISFGKVEAFCACDPDDQTCKNLR